MKIFSRFSPRKIAVIATLFLLMIIPLSIWTTSKFSQHKSVVMVHAPTRVLAAQTKQISPTLVTSSVSARSTIVPMTPTPSPLPPTHHIQLGVVVDDYANRNGTLDALQQKLSYPLTTISLYKQFGLVGNKEFLPSDLEYAKSHGMTVLLAWEPWNPDEGMQQSTDYLSQIVSGGEDDYIRSFAQAVQSYGSPVTIRFGHEMNGNWYPWGDRPDTYKAAYRHIVSLFRTIGVSNVSWMWCINAGNVPDSPIATASQFYPGDDVVDQIGIDGFNWGTANSTGWRTFSQVFSPAYAFVTSTYNKPVVIAETASAETGGNKASWIQDMLTSSLPTHFPRVQQLVWFDLLKEADWRIDSTEAAQAAFSAGLK